jgi:hypothetical protein
VSRQCTDLEGAILFIVGFVFGGTYAEDCNGWQTAMLWSADRFTRLEMQRAFENLAAQGLLHLTDHRDQPFRSDQRIAFFTERFRASLTNEGAEYFQHLRITAKVGKLHVAVAS